MLFADFPNSKFWFPEFFSSYAWHVLGEPDQTPRFEASGLVLHCLPMSHKKDARVIWANSVSNYLIHRGSYMSVHVLLNLLNELRKRDKMR